MKTGKIAAVMAALATFLAVFATVPAQAAGPAYITLLFSRTEVGAAQGCVPNDDGVATLLGTVEPYMAGLGLTGTGTLNTYAMGACVHYGDSEAATWDQAAQLVADGWSEVPHLYAGLKKMDTWTPQDDYNYTCGQATTITANLGPTANANGMMAYPGLDTGRKGAAPEVQNLQENYAKNCFSWGRMYGNKGITDSTDAESDPYWQRTESVVGYPNYTDPNTIISQIQNIQPGQWLTIQAYVLVTDTSPAGSPRTWNCLSAVHSASDEETYCWSDYQQILNAVAAAVQNGSVVVTDPLTVAAAMGRTP